MTWQCISPDVILKGLKKCCISHARDETDDMSRNGSEKDKHVNCV